MTAQRWWVRLFARWKAKVGAVQADINLMFSAVQTVTIASGVMAYFDVPTWAIGILMGGMLVGAMLYAHLYAEGGVWNHTQRYTQERSSNYSRPIMRIDDEMIARTIIAGQQGHPCTEEQIEAIQAEGDATYVEYLDGLDLSQYDR
jgi:hypothetical protein